MQGYEFIGELHRLGALAGLFEKVDLERMGEYLKTAEEIAPMFEPRGVGQGSTTIGGLRRFIAEAQKFQGVCREYGCGLRDVEAAIGAKQIPATAGTGKPGEAPNG